MRNQGVLSPASRTLRYIGAVEATLGGSLALHFDDCSSDGEDFER